MKARNEEVKVTHVKTTWQCEYCDYENEEMYLVSCHEIDAHSYTKQAGNFYYFNGEEFLARFASSENEYDYDWQGPGWYVLAGPETVHDYPMYIPLERYMRYAQDLIKDCEKALKETPDGV